MNSLDTHMALFEQLLEAANVDLRIAAGEAVVVLYESAYDHDDEASLEMVSLWEKKFVKLNLFKNVPDFISYFHL